MRYALRISLPDRPGMLGALATAMGRTNIDIIALDVVERTDGISIDDVWMETALDPEQVRRACEGVAGVVVEALAPVQPAVGRLDGVALAAAVAEAAGDPLHDLVMALPTTLGASWAVAVTEGAGGLEVLAASAQAPAIPAGLRLPFLPLQHPRRFPPAQWMPGAWQTDPDDHVELGGVPLGGPVSSVLTARINGPRFRPAELQRMADLARVAVAARGVPQGAAV